MSDFTKLLETGLLDEATTKSLQEAFDQKLNEKLEVERENLREEFANRYEHDKKLMVEAADKFFNDALKEHLVDLEKEKNSLRESKVSYKKMLREHAGKIDAYVKKQLSEEIAEIREDRKTLNEAVVRFNDFAVKHLSKELAEFETDKKQLRETKVNLIKDAKKAINESKKDFLERASKVTTKYIEAHIKKEFSVFYEDIQEARKSHFGKKLYNAFLEEHVGSNIGDSTEIRKLYKAVKQRDAKIAESAAKLEKAHRDIKSVAQKARLAESKFQRSTTLSGLLDPLPKSKRQIMNTILENVRTEELEAVYNKHIKSVLREDAPAKSSKGESLVESKTFSEVTGNKATAVPVDFKDEVNRMRKLAGIGK